MKKLLTTVAAVVMLGVGAAEWIGVPAGTVHGEPKFTKIFEGNGGTGELNICGLGQYVAYLNGQKVGGDADVLTPGWTDTRKTCIYDTYKVDLKKGANRLDVILTGGMYSMAKTPGRYQKFVGSQGPRKLKVWGCVETDTSWTISESGAYFCSVYAGDDVDGRVWLNAASGPGRAACVLPPPAGELVPATFRIKLFDKHAGINKGTHWDFGENLAYVPELCVKGKAGAKVVIKMAERWDDAKKRLYDYAGWETTQCSYILNGNPKGEVFRPPFFYRGFQYATVTVQGEAQVLAFNAYEVHADCDRIGSFICSNQMLNDIYRLIVNSQKSNMVSVFTDCPHREKLGWQEQYNCHSVQMRWEWDAAKVFAKCCRDITDAQLPNGLVPDICPEYTIFKGGFRDSIEWGSSVILVPYQQYEWTGDASFIAKMWPAMEKYMAYIQAGAKNGLARGGLGDWLPVVAVRKEVTAQAWWYWDACAMATMAKGMGRADVAAKYAALAEKIAEVYDREFWNPEKNCYCNGQQSAQALALGLGMCRSEAKRAAALKCLVNDIVSRGYQYTTGEIAYPYLLKTLSENGYGQLIFDMTIRDDKPGYGFMVKKGLTALHEDWACRPMSYNHFMFGDIIEWYYEGLAGIRRTSPAFATFRVAPCYPKGLDHVKASHLVPGKGRIAVDWQRTPSGTIDLTVTVPQGTTATVVTADGERTQTAGTVVYRAL